MEGKKPDIKIFVSHRIDQDSETIDNPLFVNVRCGATFDKRENVTILGDDTGENISEKRDSFCELTVQYWAWKNVEADYYGLCHYRRYFSFVDQEFDTCQEGGNRLSCIIQPYLDQSAIQKFGWDESTMRSAIGDNDVLTICPINTQKTVGVENNYECIRLDKCWHEVKDFDMARSIIAEKTPEYLKYWDQYFESPNSYLYDCFIMKSDIFKTYSDWLFTVLFELEKKIDTEHYNINKYRTIGTVSERMLGVFILYLADQGKFKIAEKQLVFIENPSKKVELIPAFNENNVAIVLLSSDYYIPYCSVCLQSILEHISVKNNYDIIIFEKGITDENKKILTQQCEPFANVSLRFCRADRYVYNNNFHVDYCYSVEAYYRVLTPYILSQYDKVICLDSDLIVLKDIALLFDHSLHDKLILAVRDVIFYGFINGFSPEFQKYCKEEFNMKNPYDYVNTGVMVMDLKGLRQKYSQKTIVKFMSKHKFKIQEQDGLNLLLEGKIGFIEPTWNVYAYSGAGYDISARMAPLKDYENYIEARKDPCIVHFAGRIKPWNKWDEDFAWCFWSYARRSPLYETILYRSSCDLSNWYVHAGFQSYLYNENSKKKWPKFKQKVKQVLLVFFPHGTMRHKLLKKTYCIIRGKNA